MREGGGWMGYAISQPLVALMTSVLAYPVLAIIFLFGLLVTTATPVSEILNRITSSSKWLWSKRPERAERIEEEFEISETPAFDTPVVAAWNEPEEEELDEESFDEEFTVPVPVVPMSHTTENTVAAKRPEQLLLTADVKY
jgi:S-DNA-T family DNA segregation ATPase FtsK/SpoIIIE